MFNFESDLTAIFAEWDTATVLDDPVVDPARTVQGMFIRNYQDITGEYTSYSGRISALNVTETVANTLALDQQLTVDSIDYTIAAKERQSEGLVKLILNVV